MGSRVIIHHHSPGRRATPAYTGRIDKRLSARQQGYQIQHPVSPCGLLCLEAMGYHQACLRGVFGQIWRGSHRPPRSWPTQGLLCVECTSRCCFRQPPALSLTGSLSDMYSAQSLAKLCMAQANRSGSPSSRFFYNTSLCCFARVVQLISALGHVEVVSDVQRTVSDCISWLANVAVDFLVLPEVAGGETPDMIDCFACPPGDRGCCLTGPQSVLSAALSESGCSINMYLDVHLQARYGCGYLCSRLQLTNPAWPAGAALRRSQTTAQSTCEQLEFHLISLHAYVTLVTSLLLNRLCLVPRRVVHHNSLCTAPPGPPLAYFGMVIYCGDRI